MKYLGRLLTVVTWLLVAGSVLVLVGGLFGRPLLLAAVPTGSMRPVLTPGDLILLVPKWAVGAPGLGDIVVFKTPEDQDWVVHRITNGNAAEGFVTKGDANPVQDVPRVFLKDIAGVVPQWQGQALHLPHLGLLSVEEGPLSSPVVAGVALAMGVYLLLMDARPSLGLPRIRVLRRSQARPTAVLSMYFGLAGAVFITTLLPGWVMATRQSVEFQVVGERPSNVRQAGQYLLGDPGVVDLPISNRSLLPLLVVIASESPRVVAAPTWALVPPQAEVTFTITVATAELGRFRSFINTGVFLPLLPGPLLVWLGGVNMGLAAAANALVPAGLLLGITFFDHRARLALHRLRTELALKLLP